MNELLNYNDLKPLKIYYLSSEVFPYSETSNLSKFSKEFPIFLNDQKDIEIRLMQPKYGFISERKYILREVIRLKEMKIHYLDKEYIINIKSAFIPNTRVQIYFLEYNNYFFDLPELLYKSRNGRYYKNNDEKFSFLSEVALETLKRLYWVPDVIICNNWQTSITPILIKEKMKNDPLLKDVKTVFFIHDIDSNYKFSNNLFEKMKIDYNKKKNNQEMLSLASTNADLVYVVNNNSNDKKISKILKKNKYKIINPINNLDTSGKIDLYNMLNQDIHSIV